ncbi:MAG TPA: divergent polysaccharide deacetylase family protein [Acetobacteraceae bacterium]|nr:divergent polysaccharide deacetylase family protein [Acetobacteraceae bacterium]
MPVHRRAVLASLLTASMFSPSWRAPAQLPAGPEPEGDPLLPPLAPPPAVPVAAPPPQAAAVVAPPAAPVPPTWRRHAVAVAANDPRPKIAVVIDDMGVMRARTAQAMALPAPLTFAWFPFAPDLPQQMGEAAARGHEALLHMPMQAHTNSLVQTGPDPLRVDLPAEVNLARLRDAIAAVPGVVGLNNHMGSVATRDTALMELMALQVRAHDMLFLDSVVIPHSAALPAAEAAGVPSAARDVFIDNSGNSGVIRGQLATVEVFARRHGYAIAIGHPRPHTLAALEEWLPTLPGKGFVLWPIAATVALRNGLPIGMAV